MKSILFFIASLSIFCICSCSIFKAPSKHASVQRKVTQSKTVTFNLDNNSGIIKIPLDTVFTSLTPRITDNNNNNTGGLSSGYNQDLFWASYDAARRSSFIITRSNGTYNCLAEVQPDAAIEVSKNFSGSLSATLEKTKNSGDVKAALEAASSSMSKIAELGARNSSNYLLRDALYRLNELSFNGINNDNIFETFKHTVDTIVSVAKIEAYSEIEKAKAKQLQYQYKSDSLKNNKTLDSLSKQASTLKTLSDSIASMRKQLDSVKQNATLKTNSIKHAKEETSNNEKKSNQPTEKDKQAGKKEGE